MKFDDTHREFLRPLQPLHLKAKHATIGRLSMLQHFWDHVHVCWVDKFGPISDNDNGFRAWQKVHEFSYLLFPSNPVIRQ